MTRKSTTNTDQQGHLSQLCTDSQAARTRNKASTTDDSLHQQRETAKTIIVNNLLQPVIPTIAKDPRRTLAKVPLQSVFGLQGKHRKTVVRKPCTASLLASLSSWHHNKITKGN
jgi:hypothetical protein